MRWIAYNCNVDGICENSIEKDAVTVQKSAGELEQCS